MLRLWQKYYVINSTFVPSKSTIKRTIDKNIIKRRHGLPCPLHKLELVWVPVCIIGSPIRDFRNHNTIICVNKLPEMVSDFNR